MVLPAPVGPTIATVLPAGTLKVRPEHRVRGIVAEGDVLECDVAAHVLQIRSVRAAPRRRPLVSEHVEKIGAVPGAWKKSSEMKPASCSRRPIIIMAKPTKLTIAPTLISPLP